MNPESVGLPADMPHQTTAEIVAKVHHLLTTGEGRDRISELHRTVKILLRHADSVGKSLKLARSRSTATFYMNASKATAGRLRLSVRVGGVECGELRLLNEASNGGKQRIFTAANASRFPSCGQTPASGLDWADKAVRQYLECASKVVRNPCAERSLANREAVIEADLLRAMTKRRREHRQDALAEHQPVLYPLRGLPFQFPMPIGARTFPTLGKGAGHIDVLARAGRGGRRLRVFEVKGPNAPDVEHALNQAVAYCAALRFLLEESPRPESEMLYKALGFRKTPRCHPRVEAVAVVKDTQVNRIRISQAANSLLDSSLSPFRLFSLFYTTSRHVTLFESIVPVGSSSNQPTQ